MDSTGLTMTSKECYSNNHVMDLLFTVSLLILGILLLGKGSDWLTDSLIPIAKKLGVSGVSVGLILVSIAVSLPEVLVAVFATIRGYHTLSLGVVLGSIICNIGLMSGFCAIIRPLPVTTNIILRDGIFSLVVPVLVLAVSSEGEITRFEGLAFFLLFIPYAINVFLQERRITSTEKQKHQEEIEVELALIGFEFGKLKPGWISFFLGLALLLLGTKFFGDELIHLADGFGFSELLIGTTLGALGPSLPNIGAAYSATKKGMGEIAVSETLGSNIFTLLVTLGISAMIAPITIAEQWLTVDLPILLIMSTLLFLFLLTKKCISRLEGGILLGCYLAAVALQVWLSF